MAGAFFGFKSLSRHPVLVHTKHYDFSVSNPEPNNNLFSPKLPE